MPNYDFGDLPVEVQIRIRKDFNRIAGQDQNPNMISKTELQRFISDELTGRAHQGKLTPRQTDEIMNYFSNQYDDINIGTDGLDIEEFVDMFGDQYMEQYEGSFWSSVLGFDMPRKTLNNIVGETSMDNIPVPAPKIDNTNVAQPTTTPDGPIDTTPEPIDTTAREAKIESDPDPAAPYKMEDEVAPKVEREE